MILVLDWYRGYSDILAMREYECGASARGIND